MPNAAGSSMTNPSRHPLPDRGCATGSGPSLGAIVEEILLSARRTREYRLRLSSAASKVVCMTQCHAARPNVSQKDMLDAPKRRRAMLLRPCLILQKTLPKETSEILDYRSVLVNRISQTLVKQSKEHLAYRSDKHLIEVG
jgi:hypothetical protein